jgi:CheY-like chemotaxis protein
LIESAGHHFAVSTPAEPIFVDADETRLAQVIANLLNNAVKFTPRGGHIKLAVMRDGPDVAISVVDDGIGIPADMLPRVFDMFTQVDQSLEKSHGGLGIGLTIAKRLIELHHGCIEVHSPAPAKGTEFIIRLPVAMSVVSEVDRAIDAGDSSRPARGRRILVVDDNRDAAHSLALMLGLMGADTRVAHDGLSALEVAENYRPDTVLLDLGMPKLNGYETCAQLRQQPWAKGILLVAITGWGNEDNRRRSREAGFDYHLVKPVDLRTLRQVLDSREEEESGRISGNSAAPE